MNNRSAQTPVTQDEAAIEAAIQAKGLNAPRLRPQDIDALIKSEHYFTAADGIYGAMIQTGETQPAGSVSLATLTFCVLELHNGFTVTGESACASPENFDRQIGRDIARRNARDKIWLLAGYALRDKLHRERMH